MLKLIFLTIILYIIIQHLMDDDIQNNPQTNTINIAQNEEPVPLNETIDIDNDSTQNRNGFTSVNPLQLIHPGDTINRDIITESQDPNEPKVMIFDKPNPWSKIIINPLEEYPYEFHIKVKIPSLNDFESWKQVIPNIGFDPRTGELIIPSKDEASALALANLIIINFLGQMSLQNILNKNLIQVSISKAKTYEMVQNKLKEQIMENLYGKQFTSVQTHYEQDLAKKNVENFASTSCSNQGRVDFKSETFSDTFQHFSDDSNNSNAGIEAWDGGDYSYL